MPATRPSATASGPSADATATSRSDRPVTGSMPKQTPPTPWTIGCTSTATGGATSRSSSRATRSPERATTGMAAARATSSPNDGRDTKRPAIERSTPSSQGDDERAMSGPGPRPARIAATRGEVGDRAPTSVPTGITMPGSAGSPAWTAWARAAAFPPTTPASVVSGSVSPNRRGAGPEAT